METDFLDIRIMAQRGRKKEEPSEPSTPTPPSDLSPDERAAWDGIVSDLKSISRLHKTDAKLIELYARNHAIYMRVVRELATVPLYNTGDKGRDFIHPLASLYPSLAAKERQLLSDLGLTPGTRKDEGGEDDFTQFEKRNG